MQSNQQRRSKQAPLFNNGIQMQENYKHHSLKKLMEMKILPPLHPQTDIKKSSLIFKNSPEELNQQLNFKLNKQTISKKVEFMENQTAKFGFQNNLQNSPNETIQFKTLEDESENEAQSKQQLEVTFGRVGFERHRHTIVELLKERQQNRNSTNEDRSDSKLRPFVPRIITRKQFKNLNGNKFQSIFKSIILKQNDRIEKSVKTRHKVQFSLLQRLQRLKIKDKNYLMLPPIMPKCL